MDGEGSNLTQRQVAAILGLTPRRIQQLEKEGGAPPRHEDRGYPPREFGDWLRANASGSDKARLLKAQADVAEMEAAEMRGSLLPRDQVRDCWGEESAAIRARLLVLPSVAAPQVAAPGRAAEAQAVLQKLVYEALSELSDGIPRGSRGGSDSESPRLPAAA